MTGKYDARPTLPPFVTENRLLYEHVELLLQLQVHLQFVVVVMVVATTTATVIVCHGVATYERHVDAVGIVSGGDDLSAINDTRTGEWC